MAGVHLRILAFVLIAPWMCADEPRSLCDLVEFLPAYHGEAVTLRGEVAVELKQGAMMLRANCEYMLRVRIGVHVRATAVHINTAGSAPEVREAVRQLSGEFERATNSGRLIRATATLSGRLEVIQKGETSFGFGPRKGAPAEMHLAGISDVRITPLPGPHELPVVPVCELFRDLPAYRDQRVAVRGRVVSTIHGAWLGDAACEGGFVTGGFRWPVSLSLSGNDYYTGLTGEKEARSKAPADMNTLVRDSEATETVVGTLRMLDQYSAYCRTGELQGAGLGHVGASVHAVTPLGPPIHIACLYDRWDIFEMLVQGGAGINAKDAEGRSTLAACGISSVEALAVLLKAGVDVNAEEHGKPTPLMRAIGHGSPTAVVKALLEAGAVAYATDDKGDAPLHYAVRARRDYLIPLLLDHRAVPSHRNSDGLTPLELARKTGAIFEASLLTGK